MQRRPGTIMVGTAFVPRYANQVSGEAVNFVYPVKTVWRSESSPWSQTFVRLRSSTGRAKSS